MSSYIALEVLYRLFTKQNRLAFQLKCFCVCFFFVLFYDKYKACEICGGHLVVKLVTAFLSTSQVCAGTCC